MTAALLKPRKNVTHKAVDVEGLLTQTFEDLLVSEGVTGLTTDQKERIFKAMRIANKIGYTNGFKKGAMK